MNIVQKGYQHIYEFIAQNRIGENDVDPRSIHAHLLSTITTSVLMWAYAFTAYFTISSPVPGIVGFICSILHLASPLLFRVSNNLLCITLLMLTLGYTHQGTYAYYTGGFQSHLLIWFGVIPMLGGIIAGIRASVITATLMYLFAGVFFVLEISGYQFPDLISETGETISQFLLVFGWISISTVIILNYVKLANNYEKALINQKDKTQTLLQILLHDISNRVQNISLLNRQVRILGKEENLHKYYGDIDKNVTTLHNVIHSVRRMHVVELEKKKLSLVPVALEKTVSNSVKSMEQKLKSKSINVEFEQLQGDVLCDPYILENQVLSNILSNCIKFSPEKSKIEISSSPCPTGKFINLRIKDHGIGIPQEILENLFNPRIATTRLGTKAEKGTGLGMIIVKSMIDKMGGRIEISSSTEEEKAGTVFHLSLMRA